MNKNKIQKYALLAVIVLLLTIFSSQIVNSVKILVRTAILPDVLVELVNQDRSSNALVRLQVNEKLVKAAQLKADHMAKNGYFAHIGPNGEDVRSFLNDVDYDFLRAGENLAVKFNSSEEVEKAWMESPSHRANLLKPEFSEIGIATAEGLYKGKTTTFVVQMFGLPKIPNNENRQTTVTSDSGNEKKNISLFNQGDDVVTMTRTLSFNDADDLEETLFITVDDSKPVDPVFPSQSFILDFLKNVSNLTGLVW